MKKKYAILAIILSIFLFIGYSAWATATGPLRPATQAEAEAGTDTNWRLFSPSLISHAISALAPAAEHGTWGAPVTLTLSGGVLTVPGQGYFLVATEGGAASDDLTSISGAANGDEIILAAANDAKTVVVKAGAGIHTSADFSLNNQYDRMYLQCIGSDECVEIARASNGD